MSDWLKVGTLEDVPVLGARVVRTGAGDIALFRTKADKIFALDDRCPHKDGPLSQGIVHDNSVTCPLHNWKIGLTTGEAVAPDEGCVRTYPVRLEGGDIYLQIAAKPVSRAVG